MRIYLLIILIAICGEVFSQTRTIPLYDGIPPGSENWNNPPQDTLFNNVPIEYNIIEPTLTVYPASPEAIHTGTAVIIAPGGGHFFLAVEHEGSQVAEWFSEKGVTAFVLRYRVKQMNNYPKDLQDAFSDMSTLPDKTRDVIRMAGEDGRRAVEYVRNHAEELGVNPHRIGFMGFSAGGGVTMSVALESNGDNSPDFIAPVYPYVAEYLRDLDVPGDMPAFIVVASDDQLSLAPVSVEIYNRWVEAGNTAELHVYARGGHGFGTLEQELPSDSWLERMEDWMASQGLLWPENPTGWAANNTYYGRRRWLKSQSKLMQIDFQNLQRFAEANARLISAGPSEGRVVFMGNSITEGWSRARPEFFKGKPYVNRGISGQTTTQMLARFRQDVVALNPEVVVILAGTNDIAQNTGPISLEDIFHNIASMTDLARANGIAVVLSSVLPASEYPWSPGLNPDKKIPRLNAMLEEYARENDIVFLDYFTAMANEENGLPPKLSGDGVHPTPEGYKVMEPLVEEAIERARINSKR